MEFVCDRGEDEGGDDGPQVIGGPAEAYYDEQLEECQ